MTFAPTARDGSDRTLPAMGTVEIPDPVHGWNPVPGDADAMVWWDGSALTAEAVRVGDRWEVLARAPGGVAVPSVGEAPRAPVPAGRPVDWAIGVVLCALLGLACWWLLGFVAYPDAPGSEQFAGVAIAFAGGLWLLIVAGAFTVAYFSVPTQSARWVFLALATVMLGAAALAVTSAVTLDDGRLHCGSVAARAEPDPPFSDDAEWCTSALNFQRVVVGSQGAAALVAVGLAFRAHRRTTGREGSRARAQWAFLGAWSLVTLAALGVIAGAYVSTDRTNRAELPSDGLEWAVSELRGSLAAYRGCDGVCPDEVQQVAQDAGEAAYVAKRDLPDLVGRPSSAPYRRFLRATGALPAAADSFIAEEERVIACYPSEVGRCSSEVARQRAARLAVLSRTITRYLQSLGDD